MEIVLNEFSLDGQFETLQQFLNSLRSTIKLQRIIDSTSISLLRHHELYNRLVTADLSLHQVLTDNSSRTSSEIRVFKAFLQKLMYDEPFWTTSPKHSTTDSFVCPNIEHTHSHSMAEACERDKIIMSFEHLNFQNETIELFKNQVSVILINIVNPVTLTNLLWELNLISNPELYCRFRFDGTNISFSLLEEEYGFKILDQDEIKTFFSSFVAFSQMTWEAISRSDGLQFKQYSPNSKQNDWFRNSPHQEKTIYKFRTSRRYRCFGYRENDIFYALRFEKDHEISNKG